MIHRAPKNSKYPYTMVSNGILRDGRLSFKAKGVMVHLLSLPDDWDVKVSSIAKLCGLGRDAVQGAFRELAEAGYLYPVRKRGEDGRYYGYEYEVSESCKIPPVLITKEPENQALDGLTWCDDNRVMLNGGYKPAESDVTFRDVKVHWDLGRAVNERGVCLS